MKPPSLPPSKASRLIVVCFSALCASPQLAVAQNLVWNGDFSSNAADFYTWPGYTYDDPDDYIDLFITSWDGGSGINGTATNIGTSPFSPATNAEHYAFLQGNSGISQYIDTGVGQNYLFSFEAASRASAGTEGYRQPSGVAVYANSSQSANLVLSGDVIGSSWLSYQSFQKYAFAFTATTPWQNIAFSSVGPGDHTTNIDKVAVTPISSAISIPAGTTFFTETSGTVSHSFSLPGGQVFFQRPGSVTYTGDITGTGDGGNDAWSIHSAGRLAGAQNLTFSGSTINLGNKVLSIIGNTAPCREEGSNSGGILSVADANNQKTTFHNVSLTMSNDIWISRAAVEFSGNSVVNIAGQIREHAIYDPNWILASMTIRDNAAVTVGGGLDFRNFGDNLALNGGTLTTPWIRGNNSDSVGSKIVFNGTRVVASQANASFLQVSLDGGAASDYVTAHLGSGGAIFDTNGFNITVSPPLADLPGNAGTLTKMGAGSLLLTGANTYTGATVISGGTLVAGSAGAFANKGALSMSGTGTLDLNGFNASFSSVTASTTGNTITNGGTADATLFFSNGSISSLIKNGPTNKLGVSCSNALSGVDLFKLDSPNTFSGGVKLLDHPNGTRLRITGLITTVGSSGAIVSSPYGTGAITIGTVATDRAGILFDTVGNNTLVNDIIFNTALGNDFPGIRIDTAGNTLSGKITANLANAMFSGAGSAGSVSLTGRVTGPYGLQTDTRTVMVTLKNTGTANDYAGDTIIGATSTLALGAANQIPNGTGKGNVTNNGTLKLGGFGETINGLNGAGIIDGVSGSPVLTFGDKNSTAAFSGTITDSTGTLALIKIGSGSQTLSGPNDYSGPTTISNGTLVINGNQAGATGAVTVENGARLAGSGTIGGATTLQSGATHAPGNSPGIETFVSDLTYTSGSIFEWDLASSAIGVRGTGYDGVNVGGTLGGSDAIFKILLNSGSFADGFWDGNQQWTDIFMKAGVPQSMAGIFGSFQYWEGASNMTASVPATQGYFTISGSTLNWNAVPEPASAAIGLLLGAGLLRRRRN